MSRQKIRKGSPQRNVPNESGVGFFDHYLLTAAIYNQTAARKTEPETQTLNIGLLKKSIASGHSFSLTVSSDGNKTKMLRPRPRPKV